MGVVTSLMLGVALVHGAPLVVVALLVVTVLRPELAALVLIVLSLTLRRTEVDEEARHRALALAAIAAELRNGATLRAAIADAAARAPGLPLAGAVRRANRGTSAVDLAAELAAGLGGEEPTLVAAAVRLSGDAGGRTADVFDRLALRTQQRLQLDGELRAATSQVRMSVRVLVALPLLLGLALTATGRLGAVVGSGPIGLGVLVAGATLQILGIGLVLVITRRVLS